MIKAIGSTSLLLTTSFLTCAYATPASAPVPLTLKNPAPQAIVVVEQPCAPVCAPAPVCPPAPCPPQPCQCCDYKLNYSGWYAGGQIGLGMTRNNAKFTDVDTGQSGNIPMGMRGILGGIHAGWGHQFCSNLYLGLEIYGNLYKNKTKSIPGNDTYFKDRRFNSFGIAPRLGYVMNASLMYLRLGADSAKWKYVSVSNNTGDSQRTNKRVAGIVPGIGFSQMMSNNLIIGLEGTMGFFKNSKLYNSRIDANTTINDTISNQSFDLLFRMSYLFGGDKNKPVDYLPQKAFTGPYLGAQVGYAYTLTDYPCVDVNTRISSFDRHNMQGALGGLHLGYGYQFCNRLYLGLEGTANWLSNRTSADVGGGRDLYKHKLTNSFAINPRLGYVMSGCALIYAKFGAEWARWNHAIEHNVERLYFSETKYEPGFAPGIGFAVLMTKNVMVGLESTFIVYSNEPKVRNLRNTDHDYKDRAANINLRLSYKF